MISTTTGEWERSLDEWTAGHADAVAVGDEAAAAEGAMGIGYCCLSLGRMDESLAALDESIVRGSNGVSDFILALSMGIKGMLLHVTGHLEEGMALCRKARPIQERIGDHEGGGITLGFLAQMTFASGDHASALALFREALASFLAVGDRPEAARIHCEMGWTALATQDETAARDAFMLAVHAYEEVGSPRGVGQALLGLAAVEASAGHNENAVAIATAAHSHSQRAGVVVDHPMDPGVADRIQALKALIPAQALDGLVEQGRTLSPAAVLALILERRPG